MSNKFFRDLRYVGVNTDEALTRLVRNERVYESVLNNFLLDTNFEELEKSIAIKDYSKAIFSAHTLKGISGNLGMEILFRTLDELLKKIDDNDFVDVDKIFLQISSGYHSIYSIIKSNNNVSEKG